MSQENQDSNSDPCLPSLLENKLQNKYNHNFDNIVSLFNDVLASTQLITTGTYTLTYGTVDLLVKRKLEPLILSLIGLSIIHKGIYTGITASLQLGSPSKDKSLLEESSSSIKIFSSVETITGTFTAVYGVLDILIGRKVYPLLLLSSGINIISYSLFYDSSKTSYISHQTNEPHIPELNNTSDKDTSQLKSNLNGFIITLYAILDAYLGGDVCSIVAAAIGIIIPLNNFLAHRKDKDINHNQEYPIKDNLLTHHDKDLEEKASDHTLDPCLTENLIGIINSFDHDND